MIDATLPSFDDACGDFLAAAKPLVLLGWPEPAVLTARVALERALLEVLVDFGLAEEMPRFPKLRDVLDPLQDNAIIERSFRKGLVGTYVDASRVAHGGSIRLFDAVKLVERIEVSRNAIVSLYTRGGIAC